MSFIEVNLKTFYKYIWIGNVLISWRFDIGKIEDFNICISHD